MVTGRLEEILDEKKRAADYPAINLQNLAILLRKFKYAIALLDEKIPSLFLVCAIA